MADFVPAGERRIGRGTRVLSVLGLGSCVVVILYDETARVGGLAHILLPDPSAARNRQQPWPFATTAIPALLDELEAAGADRRRITARLVGGARMLAEAMPADRVCIGERNVDAARSTLTRQGVEIIAEDVGGDNGRSLRFHLDDGRVRITQQRTGDVEI